MVTWNATLPQSPLIDSIEEEPGDTMRESPVEKGPRKTRQKYSVVEKPINFAMQMTKTQYATFLDFFDNSIAKGAIPFTLPDPYGGTMKVKFSSNLYKSRFVYPFWVVELSLMRQP